MIPLAAAEDVIDASGVAPWTGAMLPSGARARQLAVRTLLAGMMLALADGRPAHLTRSDPTDPARALVPVLTAMPDNGIPPGDILDDSGYSHRDADAWALPLRAAGAQLVQDLHPNDRGPKGTHEGAVIANGNLYCPRTPRGLLELGPLARTAAKEQAADHDRKTAELARYKPGRLTRDDPDGYHRVACPAAAGKCRRTGSRAEPGTDRRAELAVRQSSQVHPIASQAKGQGSQSRVGEAHRASNTASLALHAHRQPVLVTSGLRVVRALVNRAELL